MTNSNLLPHLLKNLPHPDLLELERKRRASWKLKKYYPDTGPLRRELYPKHLEFFQAGAIHRERLSLSANRVGKTEGLGGYETTLHLTGLYPDWWVGKRFSHPVSWVAAGTTGKTTRDIIQKKLLGPWGQFGTGLIPGPHLLRTTGKAGINDAVELAYVKHVSGGTSLLTLKSYDQRRVAFEGEERHGIWLDEEPPIDIYAECLMRTMTTDGIIMCTFTPMEGMSDTVMLYLEDGKLPVDMGSSSMVVGD